MPTHGAGPTGTPGQPIPREARNSRRRHAPPRRGPRTGASSIAPGFPIAIEAAVVAGASAHVRDYPRHSEGMYQETYDFLIE